MKEFEFRHTYTASELVDMTAGMTHLKMSNDSMKPRIRKGDLVIYDTYLKEIYAEPTPMVVKLNGTTLVREAIQDSNGVITLRSCSRKTQPITVGDDDDLEILGRVYGAMRNPHGKGRAGAAMLIPYPQPQKMIDDDPMGEGISGADAFNSLPPIDEPSPGEPSPGDAAGMMGMDPAIYSIGKYLRDAPEGAIDRYTMPDDSMAGLILPGDVLLCDKRRNEPDPRHALLYVVKIDGEATVREVWRDKLGRIRTRPHNHEYPCYMIEDGDDFEIVGKLIAISELSIKFTETGEEVRNVKMKLLPHPRRISVSEP